MKEEQKNERKNSRGELPVEPDRSKVPVTQYFSNRSVFILLHFQIDPFWIAYSNVSVFMIVFIVSV